MFVRRTLTHLILTSTLIVPLAVSTGCSNGQGTKSSANLKASEMPEGGDWNGVYFDPIYGYLHLQREGDNVNGAWRNTEGNAWGEMSGTASGDIYKFEWKEHKIGMVGKSATSEGHGYFRYSIPKAGEAHEIKGEWGLGAEEAGRKWTAVKQFNRKPDLKSVLPDEVERRGQGGGWDESSTPLPKKDKGSEAPAPTD